MILEIKKCKKITFGRTTFIFDYKIDQDIIDVTDVIKDLGIYFDGKLTFDYHINYIYKKTIRVLNFLKRNFKKFKDIKTFRNLYFIYILSTISYGSVIWYGTSIRNINLIESINHLFFRFVSYRIGTPMSYFDHDYSNISKKLNISTVRSSFMRYNLIFLYKICNNLIDCNSIVSNLYYYIPSRRVRSINNTFRLPFIHSNII